MAAGYLPARLIQKGMSAHQLHSMFGITYKFERFIRFHRICEAIRYSNDSYSPAGDDGFGGSNKVVEVDELLSLASKEPRKKEVVVSLLERDSKVKPLDVTGNALKPVLRTQSKRSSYIMTDEAPVYKSVGCEFDRRGSVNHPLTNMCAARSGTSILLRITSLS